MRETHLLWLSFIAVSLAGALNFFPGVETSYKLMAAALSVAVVIAAIRAERASASRTLIVSCLGALVAGAVYIVALEIVL